MLHTAILTEKRSNFAKSSYFCTTQCIAIGVKMSKFRAQNSGDACDATDWLPVVIQCTSVIVVWQWFTVDV